MIFLPHLCVRKIISMMTLSKGFANFGNMTLTFLGVTTFKLYIHAVLVKTDHSATISTTDHYL